MRNKACDRDVIMAYLIIVGNKVPETTSSNFNNLSPLKIRAIQYVQGFVKSCTLMGSSQPDISPRKILLEGLIKNPNIAHTLNEKFESHWYS